jgi:type IX secretion system PorP/SprF family membrane protein
MKNYIVIVVILFIFSLCKAQQEILYTQYIFSQLAVNPAYAGNNSDLSLTAINRKQWIGLDGSPNSVSLYADGAILGQDPEKARNFRKDRRFPLFSNNKQLGFGLLLFNDRIGVNNYFEAGMAYSYKINFNNYTRLSFGLQTSVMNFNQYCDRLENIDQNDATFRYNLNVIRFNTGSGVFFETEHYFISFSVPSIIKNNLDPDDKEGEKQLRQYFCFIITGFGQVCPIDTIIRLISPVKYLFPNLSVPVWRMRWE